MVATDAAEPVSHQRRFLHNVGWSWLGVGVNIVLGLVLSPILVHRLGVVQYGLWALLFSTMDYLRLLDFGFRTAVINHCARHNARREWDAMNATINTALMYFVIASGACCLAAIACRGLAMHVFNIQPDLQPAARLLIVIIAVAISARLVFSPVAGALEGLQRFDLINRAYIAALTARAAGSIVLLLSGYGLIALAYLVFAVQMGEDLWNLLSLRRQFPGLRFSLRFVRLDEFRSLFRYGRHSSLMVAASLASIQSPSTVLGYLSGPTEVAYFALPWRLLMYTAEGFGKVSQITSSITADLDARQASRNICDLAIQTNRHCLALFMPVAIFLSCYAYPLLAVWVSPQVAAASGPLLPVLVVPFVFAIAGQLNSGAVLMGQGRHGPYGWAFVVEVVASIAALFLVVPRYGAFGAACVVAVALTVNRCVFLAVLMCRVNGLALGAYLKAIYWRPLLAGVPAGALALVLRFALLPGRNWPELIAAGSLIAAAYFTVAFFAVVDGESRRHLAAMLPRSVRPGPLAATARTLEP